MFLMIFTDLTEEKLKNLKKPPRCLFTLGEIVDELPFVYLKIFLLCLVLEMYISYVIEDTASILSIFFP